MTSIFGQSTIISFRYYIDIVNQFRCNFIIFMFNYLKTSIMSSRNLLYLSVGKPKCIRRSV